MRALRLHLVRTTVEERSVKRNQFRTAPSSLQQTNNHHTAFLQSRSKYFQDISKIFRADETSSELHLLCLQPTNLPHKISSQSFFQNDQTFVPHQLLRCACLSEALAAPTMENCPNYLNLPHSPLTLRLLSPLLNVDAPSPRTLSTTFTFRISSKNSSYELVIEEVNPIYFSSDFNAKELTACVYKKVVL